MPTNISSLVADSIGYLLDSVRLSQRKLTAPEIQPSSEASRGKHTSFSYSHWALLSKVHRQNQSIYSEYSGSSGVSACQILKIRDQIQVQILKKKENLVSSIENCIFRKFATEITFCLLWNDETHCNVAFFMSLWLRL